jgi:hypothetical protein
MEVIGRPGFDVTTEVPLRLGYVVAALDTEAVREWYSAAPISNLVRLVPYRVWSVRFMTIVARLRAAGQYTRATPRCCRTSLLAATSPGWHRFCKSSGRCVEPGPL